MYTKNGGKKRIFKHAAFDKIDCFSSNTKMNSRIKIFNFHQIFIYFSIYKKKKY